MNRPIILFILFLWAALIVAAFDRSHFNRHPSSQSVSAPPASSSLSLATNKDESISSGTKEHGQRRITVKRHEKRIGTKKKNRSNVFQSDRKNDPLFAKSAYKNKNTSSKVNRPLTKSAVKRKKSRVNDHTSSERAQAVRAHDTINNNSVNPVPSFRITKTVIICTTLMLIVVALT